MRHLATITILLILTLPGTAWARPDSGVVRESTVQIAVMDRDGLERLGSGFVVAEGGYILTAAHLVASEDNIVAVPLTTGAELIARVVYSNERADLALLAVNGLALPALKFANDGFGPGRLVYSAGSWNESGESVPVPTSGEGVPAALAEGSVGKHDDLPGADDSPAVPLLEHNAMIPAAGYGGALLNECGEIVGLNRGAPGVSARRLRRGLAPEGVVHAVRITAIAGLLEPQGIEFIRSETSCIGALAAAQADAEEAQAQADAAAEQLEQSRQELQQATGQAEETREQLERIQQEKEQAAARAAEAESRVSSLEAQHEEAARTGAEQTEEMRAELDAARSEHQSAQTAVGTLEGELAALEERLEQQAAADRLRLISIVAVAAALVLVMAVVAVVFHRRRTRQLTIAHEEAARAQRAAADAQARSPVGESAYPDCLLTGQTSNKLPVSVKIPGSLLGGGGAVIGRSPRNSTLLIDDPTLSREHSRLFAEDDTLYLEDLDSTNGTKVNDRSLESRTPIAVHQGDIIEFGAVKVELAMAS